MRNVMCAISVSATRFLSRAGSNSKTTTAACTTWQPGFVVTATASAGIAIRRRGGTRFPHSATLTVFLFVLTLVGLSY